MTDWQTKKAGELLTIRHGRNQREVEAPNGIYPIFGTGGEIGRATRPLYDKPSVLIGRKGTIDKPRYIDTPFWTVDTLFYSEIKPENSPKFLYYVFNTIDWKRYNEASGVPSLSASTISTIKVNVPKKPEQERIVRVLEVWDKYIEKLERKIELKEQLKHGLTQQLLTGQQRIPGYGEDWCHTTIDEIATVVMGQSPSSSAYNETGNGLVLIQGNADMKNGKTIERIWTSEITKRAPAGSLIMTVRAPVGEIATAIQDVCLGRGVCAIKSDYSEYLRIYLSWFKPKWLQFIQGSTFESVSGSDIRKLKLSVPPREEADAIVEIVKNVEKTLQALHHAKKTVQLQKKYLLKNLITGAIRTPENLKPYEVE